MRTTKAARGAARAVSVVAAVMCGALPIGVHAADIYKSVDAQGHVTYSDRRDPSVVQSVVEGDPQTPPQEMHFCWVNCMTLVKDGDAYRRADGKDETWSIERFTAQSLVIHRHPPDSVYAGRVVEDQLLDITVNGRPVSGIQLAWGRALASVPGSNAERDQWAAERQPGNDAPRVAVPQDGAPEVADGVATAGDMESNDPPPPLEAESQPPIAQDGMLWTPGYWGWRGSYYWVPGAWIMPPRIGLLWTPGYWSFAGGVYVFHAGFWGPHVGYYGGINYGHGYTGAGFVGGRWIGTAFSYNVAVNNLNAAVVRNSYREPVAAGVEARRVSYSGGPVTPRAATVLHLPPSTPQRQSAGSVMPATHPPESRITSERVTPARTLEPAPPSSGRIPAHPVVLRHNSVTASRSPKSPP